LVFQTVVDEEKISRDVSALIDASDWKKKTKTT
jgi:hypothetical protein